MDPRWTHPFTCQAVGPSQSGKTVFTLKFIENVKEMINPPPERIVWCYGIYQNAFDNLNGIEFVEGLPDLQSFDGNTRMLLILDDLMAESNLDTEKLFTKISHHKSVSIIYLTQNMFYKSKHNRTISLNTQYFILFKNVRDATQIGILAKQMYPGNVKFMTEAFRDATKEPYGYLLVDMRQNIDDKLRLRTNIFPDEMQMVYLPK